MAAFGRQHRIIQFGVGIVWTGAPLVVLEVREGGKVCKPFLRLVPFAMAVAPDDRRRLRTGPLQSAGGSKKSQAERRLVGSWIATESHPICSSNPASFVGGLDFVDAASQAARLI